MEHHWSKRDAGLVFSRPQGGGRRVEAYEVHAVDVFSPLVVVAVAEAAVLVRTIRRPSREIGGKGSSAFGMDKTAEVVVFLLEPGYLLLEFPDFEEGRRDDGDLVWGVVEGHLEFCDGLF